MGDKQAPEPHTSPTLDTIKKMKAPHLTPRNMFGFSLIDDPATDQQPLDY